MEIELAMQKIGQYMVNRKWVILGLPYNMGCGLAGGDWDTVLGIITRFTNNYPQIQVFIVRL